MPNCGVRGSLGGPGPGVFDAPRDPVREIWGRPSVSLIDFETTIFQEHVGSHSGLFGLFRFKGEAMILNQSQSKGEIQG